MYIECAEKAERNHGNAHAARGAVAVALTEARKRLCWF